MIYNEVVAYGLVIVTIANWSEDVDVMATVRKVRTWLEANGFTLAKKKTKVVMVTNHQKTQTNYQNESRWKRIIRDIRELSNIWETFSYSVIWKAVEQR